jgi:hypothetical protein
MTSPAVTLTAADVDIRVGLDSDAPHIIDRWVSLQRHIYPNRFALDWSIREARAIAAALDRCTSLVAHLDGDMDTRVGFVVAEAIGTTLVVHYAHVEDSARRQRIATKLVELANPEGRRVAFTHAPMNERAMAALCRRYVFAPSLWRAE